MALRISQDQIMTLEMKHDWTHIRMSPDQIVTIEKKHDWTYIRMSPDRIMTIEKKYDWNYINTHVGHLGGKYGTIISSYRDKVDTEGTHYRINMDICHDTGIVAISIKTLEDQMINLRKQQEVETL